MPTIPDNVSPFVELYKYFMTGTSANGQGLHVNAFIEFVYITIGFCIFCVNEFMLLLF